MESSFYCQLPDGQPDESAVAFPLTEYGNCVLRCARDCSIHPGDISIPLTSALIRSLIPVSKSCNPEDYDDVCPRKTYKYPVHACTDNLFITNSSRPRPRRMSSSSHDRGQASYLRKCQSTRLVRITRDWLVISRRLRGSAFGGHLYKPRRVSRF